MTDFGNAYAQILQFCAHFAPDEVPLFFKVAGIIFLHKKFLEELTPTLLSLIQVVKK
jgi:hypothetical protein